MSFEWPLALFFALVGPLLLVTYIVQLRRKRKRAIRLSSVAVIKAAMPKRSRWRRHLPVALFLGALTTLAFGTARPRMTIEVPSSRTSIMLALDVSRSMCATDVTPNRLAVAQNAAKSFVKAQKGARIGIVAFAGSAQVLVPPTTDRDALLSAINGLTTARGTAIGAATLKSIDALSEVNRDVLPSIAGGPTPVTGDLPTPPGPFVPDIVVLLTDGANTRGIAPLDAAVQAAERKVRVYTIGFGTQNPAGLACTREQVGGSVFGNDNFPQPGAGAPAGGGGAGGGANRQFLVADEATLKKVAAATGGQYFKAENADQLGKVFADLPSRVETQKAKREISVVFAIAGALLAAAAVTLSLLWNRFP